MSFGKTVNLGNSIIGVSILAMPYCFAQSGLILSILLILFSGFLTRLSCHFLLKSAFIAKRRSFELMVQDVLGSTGRILIELGLIGFLLGTCVAYFIMIGDLAPKVLAEMLDIKYSYDLRLISTISLAVFVALPLSLLRKVDSLTSFSLLSMILYSCLILKLLLEATGKVKVGQLDKKRLDEISYWNSSGLLATFPIFSMAMSCQTSLFEIFDGHVINSDFESVRRDNGVIKKVVYVCSFVYITVGILGYTAFHDLVLHGNILLAFAPSTTTLLTKIGFIITLLMSFPLCLFPCRTSVYSLTFGKMRNTVSFQPLTNHDDHDEINMKSNCDLDHEKKEFLCDNDRNNNSSVDSCIKEVNHRDAYLLNNDMKVGSIPCRYVALDQEVYQSHNGKHPCQFPSLLEDLSFDDKLNQINGQNNFTANLPARLYISDFHFKFLTIVLIGATVALSLLFPNIEFILGIIGSTAGTTVCFILPAYTFMQMGDHSRVELLLARLLLAIGLAMLIFCSYSTIHRANIMAPHE